MQRDEILRIEIPGETEYIALARRAVDAVGQQIALSRAACAEITLAVGEACNNAVFHARPEVHTSVTIACRLEPDALEIEVTNRGNGYHPTPGASMPHPEELTESGRGRALMEILMDSVEYLADGGNTTVRLRKKRGCLT